MNREGYRITFRNSKTGLETEPSFNMPAPVAAPVKFISIKRGVMQGSKCVAVAISKTMAKRIARALNNHVVNSEGV